MSYDLMVFNPEVAPRGRKEFINWYREITKWQEKRNYNSIVGASGNLPLFYTEMKKKFPAMNGPDASDDFDSSYVSDYNIATNAIYITFAWSVAEEAFEEVKRVAKLTGVGFFDVSANDGAIIHEWSNTSEQKSTSAKTTLIKKNSQTNYKWFLLGTIFIVGILLFIMS